LPNFKVVNFYGAFDCVKKNEKKCLVEFGVEMVKVFEFENKDGIVLKKKNISKKS
jgi:hypothetical protein